MRRQPGTGEQLPHARQQPSAEFVPNNTTQSAAMAVLEALPDPVVVLNRRGLITGWNPAAEELFGWYGEEVLGRPWTEFVVADGTNGNALSHLDAIGSTVQRGGTWEGSFPLTTRNGDSLLARVRAAPMMNGGMVTGTVVTAIDLFGSDASRDDQQ